MCSITVCLKDSGRCDGITPPECSPPIASDSVDNTKRVKRGIKSDEWELHSPLITVFDPVDQNNEDNDFTQSKEKSFFIKKGGRANFIKDYILERGRTRVRTEKKS
ncbi:unnamed protein product [Meloidogyne enterolobii]|uniref:Uncharacterized protein n=1 Tax=Meloidogyne enterolobii TaxID=390850 RepID=A0ACB1ANA1_MELEN